MPDVITANRLADGVVVFQSADGTWTEDFKFAAVLADAQATAVALARAKEDEANNLVVDAYATPVVERNGHFVPKALREAIRATGPTTPTGSSDTTRSTGPRRQRRRRAPGQWNG